MKVRVLIFDLDNTLVPEMGNYEAAFDLATEPLRREQDLAADALRTAVFDASLSCGPPRDSPNTVLGLDWVRRRVSSVTFLAPAKN
jgi:hypothetical protein